MKRFAAVILVICLLAAALSGCAKKELLDPANPVTLSLWHNYGGVMQEAMDRLVEEFNDTKGKELGIIVNVEAVNSSSVLQERLLASANGDPGASKLPDITTCYPKIAVILAEKGLLADLDGYFSAEELSAYVPSFVEEGRIGGKLYVFPTAKSTEVLFLNRTLFDRFAAETGASVDSLSTFEGIFETAELYYNWTDAMTPEAEGDGKAFYKTDSMFNVMQLGMEQLGESFVSDEKLNTASQNYSYIYDMFHNAAEKGWLAVYDGYSSDLQKTGDILASTGSTAGILYYGYSVTYPDNTTETVEYNILPYPVVEGGEKVALQRGNGMAVTASDEQREYAACVFLKWFTEKDHNLQFLSQTGYLPVTNEAFDTVLSGGYSSDDVNIQKLLDAAVLMQKEYRFYIPPVFEKFDSLGSEWEASFYSTVK